MNPYKAIDFILDNAPKYAKAKAERIYIEEFRKSKKAMLMQLAQRRNIDSAVAQEREAYAHEEYVDLLKGLSAAVEIEETLRWQLEAARLNTEIWRTEQANARAEGRATQ